MKKERPNEYSGMFDFGIETADRLKIAFGFLSAISVGALTWSLAHYKISDDNESRDIAVAFMSIFTGYASGTIAGAFQIIGDLMKESAEKGGLEVKRSLFVRSVVPSKNNPTIVSS